MALTEYSITYTKTNQDSKSTGNKAVAVSSGWKITGSTGVGIGQITRITFKHVHSASAKGTWKLQGRLSFAGRSITSDTISKAINYDYRTYVNTFTDNLPSPEEWAAWTDATILIAGKGSGTLYWMASAKYPMTVTVYFYRAEHLIVDAAPPVIAGADIADSSGYAETYGSPVQGKSALVFTGRYALDPAYPSLSARHTLQIVDAGGDTIYSATQGDDAVFEVGAIAAAGTLTWTYSLTDSAGGHADAGGSLTVLPYAPPSVSGFAVERYAAVLDDQGNPTYVAAEDGDHVRFTFTASATPVGGGNPWTLTLDYGEQDSDYGVTVPVAAQAAGGRLDYAQDRDVLTAAVSASSAWRFTVTARDAFGETGSMTGYVDEATAYFNIEAVGVSVGMRSGGTNARKLFEVADDYESRFYGGIRGVTNYALGEAPTGGRWIDGKQVYRYVAVGTATLGASTTLLTLPEAIDTVVDMRLVFHQNQWKLANFTYYGNSNWDVNVMINADGGVVAQAGTSARISTKYVFAVEYTKADDDVRTLWVSSDAGGNVVLAEQAAGSFAFTGDGDGAIAVTAMPDALGVSEADGAVALSAQASLRAAEMPPAAETTEAAFAIEAPTGSANAENDDGLEE